MPAAFDGVVDGFEIVGRGEYLKHIALVLHIVGAGLDGDLEKLILGLCGLVDDDVALLVEHPGDRARLAHVAAVL